jgi:hypothetical protein
MVKSEQRIYLCLRLGIENLCVIIFILESHYPKLRELTFDADTQTDSDSEVGSEDGHVLITSHWQKHMHLRLRRLKETC